MARTEKSVTAYDVEDWKNKGGVQMPPAARANWLNFMGSSLRRWQTGASSF